jgi:hypothetical protein
VYILSLCLWLEEENAAFRAVDLVSETGPGGNWAYTVYIGGCDWGLIWDKAMPIKRVNFVARFYFQVLIEV